MKLRSMSHLWSFEKADQIAFVPLAARLPATIFDAHAHLYRKRDISVAPGSPFDQGPDEVAHDVWREHIERQLGHGRAAGALFIPVPFAKPALIPKVNEWIFRVTSGMANSKTLALVSPGMKSADIEPLFVHAHLAGFKPYHTYSVSAPTWDALPGDYIPDWLWPMAHERGLAITLHLVRQGAMADAGNQRYLREHCERFPNARVILAHGGRAFHAPNAAAGAAALNDLDNIWFDISAICEAEPLLALLDAFGPRRLMWGSDFPISEMRSRCVTAGDGFIWISSEAAKSSSPECRLFSVGFESLRAFMNAADEFGLNAADMVHVFGENARRMLGLLTEHGDITGDLYRHAKRRIPGGTQLLSKRPEMFAPCLWPAYFHEARGCETWDMDGRHYYDMSSFGIGACLLGFREPSVTRAVIRRVRLGSMCTLNPPEEVELADRLCALHPWAERVRFARCGGEMAAVAVRIARATTGRSVVAVCGYHGWHDWYLAANLGKDDSLRGHLLPGLEPAGVPSELRGTCVAFTYNNRKDFLSILAEHGTRLAAVIMEPCRHHDPDPGFLEFVKDGAHRAGALLIFDEISIGWRLHHGGAHMKRGIAPDMAIFAKALGNGHPVGAVIGTSAAMDGAEKSFISSTYWTEGVGPAAALAVLMRFEQVDIPAHVNDVGARVKEIWWKRSDAHRVSIEIDPGYSCLACFKFDHDESAALKTLFTQGMLDRGFLAGTSIYPSLAHDEAVLGRYDEAASGVFADIADALACGDVERRLRGPVAHTGFRRLL